MKRDGHEGGEEQGGGGNKSHYFRRDSDCFLSLPRKRSYYINYCHRGEKKQPPMLVQSANEAVETENLTNRFFPSDGPSHHFVKIKKIRDIENEQEKEGRGEREDKKQGNGPHRARRRRRRYFINIRRRH